MFFQIVMTSQDTGPLFKTSEILKFSEKVPFENLYIN